MRNHEWAATDFLPPLPHHREKGILPDRAGFLFFILFFPDMWFLP